MRRGKRIMQVLPAGILLCMLCMLTGCSGKDESATLEEIQMAEDKELDASDAQDGSGETEADGSENGSKSGPEKGADTEESGEVTPDGMIYVFVCGQVSEPGVYKLGQGSRLCDAIEAAGGMLDTAAADWVNQAEPAEDGQKIYVPSREEAESMTEGQLQADGRTAANGQAAGASSGASDGKIHLNQASREELMTLTGIGEAKADAIIRYRESNGGFRSIEELMQVDGIKEGTYNKIKDSIAI